MCSGTDKTCILSEGNVYVANLIVCVASECGSHCRADQIMLGFADEAFVFAGFGGDIRGTKGGGGGLPEVITGTRVLRLPYFVCKSIDP